jgi:CENP-Q, a CENPA-CAD centromere complex subunit
MHSIELLKSAIDDENDALERDEEALAILMGNAKREESQHKRLAKRASFSPSVAVILLVRTLKTHDANGFCRHTPF